MTSLPSPDTLVFYRRDGCAVCDEARLSLQQVLEDRAKASERTVRVRYVDVDTSEDLRTRYGGLVPVLALAGDELALSSGYRPIAAFLDRALGRRA
jgi:peroxiredoxin